MEFYEIEKLPELANVVYVDLKKLFSVLKKKRKKELDYVFHALHHEAFSMYDCLYCGNCCRGLGPRIIEKDIDVISKGLKTRQRDFINDYLRIDEDNDFVFKSMPCPFLATDNYCHIYENRPKACREYPHTNKNKIHQDIDVFLKNISVCPVCLWIAMKILEHYRDPIK